MPSMVGKVSGGENWDPWRYRLNSFEKVSKVSWMSVDGEPLFILGNYE